MSETDPKRDQEGAVSPPPGAESPTNGAAKPKLTMMDRGRAYLEVARLSNAPTVISNVLTGAAIGLASSAAIAIPWITLAYLGFGVLLLYVGGMALNDWVDAPFDRRHNPGRPIPSGRMSRTAALLFAVFSFAEGTALVGMASRAALIPAGMLVVLIIAYNLLHKRHASTVLLMGLCRGIVYVVAATAMTTRIGWSTAAPLAAALAVYVTLVTVVAAREHKADSRGPVWVGILLAAVVLAPLVLVEIANPTWLISAAALFGLWTMLAGALLITDPPQTRAAVLRWLAGICLIDVVYLSAIDQPLFVSIALVCFILTLLAHRRIPGT